MDALTRFALVGTARGQQAEGASDGDPSAEAVLAKMGDVPIERRVLLAAGARAMSNAAGARALQRGPKTEVAPLETLPECSPKAARLFGDLFGGQHPELLPEALGLLSRAGRRLPHVLLVDALRVRGDALKDAVRPVLGERGRWLARLNDSWAWALEGASSAASVADLQRTWGEGAIEARRGALSQARGVDAEAARGWLESTWTNEKADDRASFVAILGERVAAGDEPFLEGRLGDRSVAVRGAIQGALARLPESAFVRRMTERADAMIAFKRSALAIVGKRGTLDVRPPESVDEAADRDGLLQQPPQGVGARAFWLTRAVSAIPPRHWVARFDVTPAELVAAAEKTDWAAALCEGWTRAALTHRDAGDVTWLAALWDFWQRASDKVVSDRIAPPLLLEIVRALPAEEAAARVEPLFADAPSRIDLYTALGALPTPWPASLGARWVSAARRELAEPSARSLSILHTVRLAILALPASAFADAIALAEAPLRADPSAPNPWTRPLAELSEVLRLRHDIVQEIVP